MMGKSHSEPEPALLHIELHDLRSTPGPLLYKLILWSVWSVVVVVKEMTGMTCLADLNRLPTFRVPIKFYFGATQPRKVLNTNRGGTELWNSQASAWWLHLLNRNPLSGALCPALSARYPVSVTRRGWEKGTKVFFSPEHFISWISTDKVVKIVVRYFPAVLTILNIDWITAAVLKVGSDPGCLVV